MEMPGRKFEKDASEGYRFGFTGHEKESDLAEGVYTTEYRLLDARVGWWLSVDPMFGKYPDLSSYNYCEENPMMFIDMHGDSSAVLTAPKGAGGAGHLAVLIQHKDKKWYLYSKNGTDDKWGIYGENRTKDNDGKLAIQKGVGPFESVQAFLDDPKSNKIQEDGNPEYTEAYVIPMTEKQDELAIKGAMKELNKKYFLGGSNCAKTVQSALSEVGWNGYRTGNYDIVTKYNQSGHPYPSISFNWFPNTIYSRIKARNHGEKLQPSKK